MLGSIVSFRAEGDAFNPGKLNLSSVKNLLNENLILTWVKAFNHVLHEFLLFFLCDSMRIHAFSLGILFYLIVDDIFCDLRQRKSTSSKGRVGSLLPTFFFPCLV